MQLVKVFVASPSDVQDERDQLESVIGEINLTHGTDDYRLELLMWQTHVVPEMGFEPQDVINRQIGEYDIFVGILWGRIGTPTSKADSGTEEEFERAYTALKQRKVKHILFYFCEAPLHLSSVADLEQRKKVVLFRQRIEQEKLGLIGTYSSAEDFHTRVRPDLIRVLREISGRKQQPIGILDKASDAARSKPYVIGVDIGTTKIAAAVIELGTSKPPIDRDINTLMVPTGAAGNPDLILATAYDHIAETVAKKQVSWDKIAGIGIGLPGPVDFTEGTLKFSPGLKIENVPFKYELRRRFRRLAGDNLDIRIDNDARCAARCELYLGQGKSIAERRSHFVVIFIGTGVGSGIVVGGKVYHGAKSYAGEIGHTKIRDSGPLCNCGATGCLETFVTGPAIVRIAKERAIAYKLRSDKKTSLDEDHLTEFDIAKALEEEDDAALDVAQEVGELLGEGIANYANVLNPELVILGGGIVVGFYDYLGTHIRKGFQRWAYRDIRTTSIVPSDFERSGPVIGAALLFHPDENHQE